MLPHTYSGHCAATALHSRRAAARAALISIAPCGPTHGPSSRWEWCGWAKAGEATRVARATAAASIFMAQLHILSRHGSDASTKTGASHATVPITDALEVRS